MGRGAGGPGWWWGPVFDAERTTRARRWQGYALRSLFVLGLLVGLWLVWAEQRRTGGFVTVQQQAEVGASLFFTLTLIELVAVLLVAPAATAGAICLDRSRGALAHVFVTDLTDREIVLGKLAARLLPVWGLLACAFPVAALATMLGGIDPMALLGASLVVAGVAALGCAYALLLSAWATRPAEVLAVVFATWMAWLLACPLSQLFGGMAMPPGWLAWSNPYYLISAPSFEPGSTTLAEPAWFALGCLVLATACTALAVGTVRGVGRRSPRRRARASGRDWPWRRWGPRLDADPVLWREWHRNRATRWTRLVWLGYGVAASATGGGMIFVKLNPATNRMPAEAYGLLVGLLVAAGLLLVSTATASVLAEERVRGSLDVLLAAPVSTRRIVRAKWWGAFRRVPWLTVWPVLMGFVVVVVDDVNPTTTKSIAVVFPLILAQGALLVSIGLAAATWIRRPGLATTWTVGVEVFFLAGWPILQAVLPLSWLLSDPDRYDPSAFRQALDIFLACGCPFINAAFPSMIAHQTYPGSEPRHQAVLAVLLAWTAIYSLAAWALYELTVRTFDRRLGRMPERPTRPRPAPARPVARA